MLEVSREYLLDAYVEQKLSTYQIAQNLNTYPNQVKRLLEKYNIPIRTKSEAQSNALKAGRHKHPTKGQKRPEDVKIKISEGVGKVWKNISEEDRNARVLKAKEQWINMSPEDKKKLQESAGKAIRNTAKKGSKLEQYILLSLRMKGYKPVFHAGNILSREGLEVDILLPEIRTAIEIDGPAHFYPIWGEDNLLKTINSDNSKNGLLIQAGFYVIRVKCFIKTLSDIKQRELLKTLLDTLEKIQAKSIKTKLIEIEVKI